MSRPESRRRSAPANPPPAGRYQVVDPHPAHGDIRLPGGQMGRLLATFHTEALAIALVDAERARGRHLIVLDAEATPDSSQSGCRVAVYPDAASPPWLAFCDECQAVHLSVGDGTCPECGAHTAEAGTALAARIVSALLERPLEVWVRVLDVAACESVRRANAQAILAALARDVPETARLTREAAAHTELSEPYLVLLLSLVSDLLDHVFRAGGSTPGPAACARMAERATQAALECDGDAAPSVARATRWCTGRPDPA